MIITLERVLDTIIIIFGICIIFELGVIVVEILDLLECFFGEKVKFVILTIMLVGAIILSIIYHMWCATVWLVVLAFMYWL